jgi:hypothetical protein
MFGLFALLQAGPLRSHAPRSGRWSKASMRLVWFARPAGCSQLRSVREKAVTNRIGDTRKEPSYVGAIEATR